MAEISRSGGRGGLWMNEKFTGGADAGRLAGLMLAACVLLGLLPVFALGGYAYHVAAAATQSLIERGNSSAAMLTRDLVRQKFESLATTSGVFAGLSGVQTAVERHDEEGLRRSLQVLVGSTPEIVRAFVTDLDGRLWSDFPKAPESLGKLFADRDWYRGVSQGWRPYVSEVYQRNAIPKILLVAIAVPIRNSATGAVTGILVSQVRLESLADLLRAAEVGAEGYVLLLDPSGAVAAHPTLDLQADLHREYGASAPIAEASDGRTGGIRYLDPIGGNEVLASALPVEILGRAWTVVAQQPLAVAYAPTRLLAWQIGGAGVLVAIVVAGLGLVLYRSHRRLSLLMVQDRERVESQLRQAQKMEATGQLTGGLAHDFNNLLTVVIGNLDLLAARLDHDAKGQGLAQSALSAGLRGSELTRKLLAFSRQQPLEAKTVDVNDLVRGMTQMLERTLGESVEIRIATAAELWPVDTDPTQLESALVNLAINSRDAMPGGGRITIETQNAHLDAAYAAQNPEVVPGDYVMLVVSDTGKGIPPEQLERVIEPFFTTKEVGKGSGLGLSMIYGFAKQSGGHLKIYSEVDHGTAVRFYLPRSKGGWDAIEIAAPQAVEPAAGGETVLVVDDNAPVRDMVMAQLADLGYRPLEAVDAGSAIDTLKAKTQIDLLLTDVVMPGGMSGIELAENARRLRPDIRVLFTSGFTEAAIRDGNAIGDDQVLSKPYRKHELAQMLRAVLDRAA
jgi:signal transduction histidine kinase/ActR/RegA family two-component response regulator